jgi:hypothetical protein
MEKYSSLLTQILKIVAIVCLLAITTLYALNYQNGKYSLSVTEDGIIVLNTGTSRIYGYMTSGEAKSFNFIDEVNKKKN